MLPHHVLVFGVSCARALMQTGKTALRVHDSSLQASCSYAIVSVSNNFVKDTSRDNLPSAETSHWDEIPDSRKHTKYIYPSDVSGVSEKYPTCVYISALVLFFIIRTVASFEVVPIWLNHTLPAVLPHLKGMLEWIFYDPEIWDFVVFT